jgi:hypothetical protein
MKIEMGKKYQTRDGKQWRTYCVDGGGVLPVHGAFLDSSGWRESPRSAEGKVYLYGLGYPGDYPGDLIEVPETFDHGVMFLNVYDTGFVACHKSLETAKEWACDAILVARLEIHVKGKVGEGLEQ